MEGLPMNGFVGMIAKRECKDVNMLGGTSDSKVGLAALPEL